MSVLKSISKTIVASVFAVSIAVSSSAFAQAVSESHIAAAKRVIAATSNTRNLDNILPQTAQALKNELIRNRPDQESVITDVVDLVALELAPRRGDLESEVAQIFTRVFTEVELTEIAGFFETDAGKKFLTDSPLVLREINAAAQVWTRGIQRDMGTKATEKLTAMGLQ